ncbi:MAG: hypothetical protein PVI21_06395 [Candidatus Woesebacteria bacterium]|jgi:hypothetical protein
MPHSDSKKRVQQITRIFTGELQNQYHVITLSGSPIRPNDTLHSYIALYRDFRRNDEPGKSLPLETWYVPLTEYAEPTIFTMITTIQFYALRDGDTAGMSLVTLPDQSFEDTKDCEDFLDDATVRLASRRINDPYLPLAMLAFLGAEHTIDKTAFFYPAELPANRLLRILKTGATELASC